MKNKKQKRSIAKWVVFGIIVAATIVITVFNTKLFGKKVVVEGGEKRKDLQALPCTRPRDRCRCGEGT